MSGQWGEVKAKIYEVISLCLEKMDLAMANFMSIGSQQALLGQLL